MAKLSAFRKVKFWVIYDPSKHTIVELAKFKRLLGNPSRQSGRVLIQCSGFYPSPAIPADEGETQ